MPPADDLLVGTFEEVLPRAEEVLPQGIVLVHADIGTGDEQRNARLAAQVATHLGRFLSAGCLIASDQALPAERLAALPVPEDAMNGRYHLYRVTSQP